MLAHPAFWLAAVPAVLIFGVTKGGFGGGLGIAATPLLATVLPPAEAAAVLLPLLCVMDIVGIGAYRHTWHAPAILVMAPGALLGITLASLVFRYLPEDGVRLLLGLVAVLFAGQYFLRRRPAAETRPHRPAVGAVLGMAAGFTSTIAHAGGPPANMYLLPLRLNKTVYVGSMVILFAIVNATKLLPYTLLGLFDRATLTASLALAPVAVFGMVLGIWLHKRVDAAIFYRLCYFFVLLTGVDLIWNALA